ncbi:nucleotidyltransferase family protein [uncultured Tessaracoccus sp.]|uniref:nucleotidyltransferase family protein n=1 Tax=uncultured Tessaracoccus sp. TaxID=905023 RepID=UPI0025DAA0C5|nr:nucleotidyltransferase family protein [uncultured Tessaracoccus sp.]
MITTAVVLARGLGTRMRAEGGSGLTPEQVAAASRGHKALMPLGDHCLIDYSLSALADAGIRRVVLVVAPEHEDFTAHVEELAPERLTIEFAVQEEPLGTANAVAAAESVVGDEPCLVVNGDNLYPVDGLRKLTEAKGHALLGFDRQAMVEQSNIPADRIAAFALVEARDGVLVDILEKPSEDVVAEAGEHALVSMNCFAFTPAIFAACREVKPSARGEYEIVDAVRALDHVEVIPVASGVLDLSRRDDVAAVEALLADMDVRP